MPLKVMTSAEEANGSTENIWKKYFSYFLMTMSRPPLDFRVKCKKSKKSTHPNAPLSVQ
jgi:hypothetical protein